MTELYDIWNPRDAQDAAAVVSNPFVKAHPRRNDAESVFAFHDAMRAVETAVYGGRER